MELNPNTPILVGAKTLTQRLEDPTMAKDALELMVEATELCAENANAETSAKTSKAILKDLDAIICMQSMTPMDNPAQLLGLHIGAEKAKSIVAEVGTLQQSAFDLACDYILNYGANAVLVAGTEAQYRNLRAKITGQDIPALNNPPTNTDKADVVLEPETKIIHPLELEMELYTAPSHYSLLENAFGIHKNLTPTEQRLETAKLWAAFSKTASQNPFAAFKEPQTAEQIATPSDKNRIICAPYNKWNCSQINVDQSSALLFMSVQHAQKLGIDEQNWIFPLASAVSNHMVPIIERKELHRCQGFEIVGQAAIEAAELNSAIDYFDLYSCFPIAVWLQAQELGLDINQQLTVTGGMSFSGGPLNSFVLGSLVRMVEVLREKGEDKVGLVTSISGMITKQGVGIWSTQPPEKSPAFLELSKEVAQKTPTCEVELNYSGSAKTVTSNMLYDREGKPKRAVCIADTPDGKRVMAFSTDNEILTLLDGDDYLGRLDNQEIQISNSKEFTLVN